MLAKRYRRAYTKPVADQPNWHARPPEWECALRKDDVLIPLAWSWEAFQKVELQRTSENTGDGQFELWRGSQ